MPQFDIATFSEQIFWLFVIFGILYFLMSKIALPKVGEVLERRHKTIEDNLGKARALKDETDAAIAKYEAALAEARDAHRQIFAKQRRKQLQSKLRKPKRWSRNCRKRPLMPKRQLPVRKTTQ